MYILFLGAILFMRSSDGFGFGIDAAVRRLNGSINYTPFYTIKRYIEAYNNRNIGFSTFFLNIYGNALLFFPMGIILPRIFQTPPQFFSSFIMILALILSAELIQLLSGVGKFDIDDIILNISGALIPLIIIRKHR